MMVYDDNALILCFPWCLTFDERRRRFGEPIDETRVARHVSARRKSKRAVHEQQTDLTGERGQHGAEQRSVCAQLDFGGCVRDCVHQAGALFAFAFGRRYGNVLSSWLSSCLERDNKCELD